MHVDTEQLQRFVDGELPRVAEAELRRHLESCAECREHVERGRRGTDEFHELLRNLDHGRPPATVGAITARAAASPRWAEAAWLRVAATIVLALALAGTAYAIPGSPLSRWWRDITRGGSPEATPAIPEPATPPALSGLAVEPGDSLVIEFAFVQASGALRVALTDGGVVSVQGPSGAATYASDANRLVVGNRGSVANFEVLIPRVARTIEIRVQGARVFRKDGTGVSAGMRSTLGAGPGVYSIPLTRQ